MQDNYDLIVVGAGVAGLYTAIAALLHGRKVLILEKGLVGSGSSVTTAATMHQGAGKFGGDVAEQLAQLQQDGMHGADLLPGNEHGYNIFVDVPTYYVFDSEVARDAFLAKRDGFKRKADPNELTGVLMPEKLNGDYFFAEVKEVQLNPQAAMTWLAAKAVALGADIVTGAGASGISEDFAGVETAELGRVSGDAFVVAAGPETFNILERTAVGMAAREQAEAAAFVNAANAVQSSYLRVFAKPGTPSVRSTFKHGPIYAVQIPGVDGTQTEGFLSGHAVQQKPGDPSKLAGIVPAPIDQVRKKIEIAENWFQPGVLELSADRVSAYGAIKTEVKREGATAAEIADGSARRQLPASTRLRNAVFSIAGQWSQAGFVGLSNVLNLLGLNSAREMRATLGVPVDVSRVESIIFNPASPRIATPQLTNSAGSQRLATAGVGLG